MIPGRANGCVVASMRAEAKQKMNHSDSETLRALRLLCLVVSDAGVGSGVENFPNSVENFK